MGAGGRAQFWHLDVSRESEVESVFGDVERTFGQINVLVNNAGISGANKPTHEVSEEEWDKLMAVPSMLREYSSAQSMSSHA